MSDPDTREKCSAARARPTSKPIGRIPSQDRASIRVLKDPNGERKGQSAGREIRCLSKVFNNGERSTLFLPETVPDGWVPGKCARRTFA